MKITLAQLETQLAKPLAPVYLLSGDDLFLKQEAITSIRKAAKKADYQERIRITPGAGFDWEQLYPLLYSGSLLAEKRFIELDCREILPNKAAASVLEKYQPDTSVILLIDLNKIEDKTARSAWYKALEKIGVIVTIWPLAKEQLPSWIIQRGKKYQLSIQYEAAHLLADYVEGNLMAAAQTIEKIYLLRPEKAVDTSFIQHILADESQFNVFDFTDSLVSGDLARALHILQNLEENGFEPVLVLWSITRELRLLADFATQLQQGISFEQLWQKQRIFSKRQPGIKRFLKRFTSKDCWEKLTQAAHIDKIIKGLATGNPWQALHLFCLRMI